MDPYQNKFPVTRWEPPTGAPAPINVVVVQPHIH